MDTSFFLEKPSELLRLKIERVLLQIRGGIHKSKVKGEGPEFRGFRPWDPSDNPARINYPTSYKISPELDEVVVRTSYGDKRISVVVALDLRATMGYPLRKLEHASALFWFFALTAFREQDRFRTVVVFDHVLVDSGWILRESALEGFLEQEVVKHEPGAATSHQDVEDYVSLLADSRLSDAFLVVISDFCASWEKEIRALDWLGMSERNIKGIFIALDEWSDIEWDGYGAEIQDPLTGSIVSVNPDVLKEISFAARAQLAALEKSLSGYPVSLLKISMLRDPLEEFLRLYTDV